MWTLRSKNKETTKHSIKCHNQLKNKINIEKKIN